MRTRYRTCLICGSPPADKELLLNDYRQGINRPTGYVICSSCHAVYQKAPLAREEMNTHYPEAYSYYRKAPGRRVIRSLFSPLLSAMMQPLARYVPSSSPNRERWLLDVGCGGGAYLQELRAGGFCTAEGIELSADAVQQAREKGVMVTHASLMSFKASRRYDIITLHQVFEHFRYPNSSIRKLARLLKEDGMMVMSFPNRSSLAAALFGRFWPGYDAPRHYFTYNPRAIQILCGRHNLAIVAVRYISRPSQFTGALQYMWNYFTGRFTQLEEGYFRNSVVLDLLFFPLSYLLNGLKWGDMIEVYIRKTS